MLRVRQELNKQGLQVKLREVGWRMHGAQGTSKPGSALWARVGTAEIGGKDIPSIWNCDKSMRGESQGLGQTQWFSEAEGRI